MIVEQNTCVYCGSGSSLVKEHVIPCSFFGFRTLDSDKQWIVTGCDICNRLAGSYVCFSIPEKSAYILKRYKQKYKKILDTPHWSEEELHELKYTLRMTVIAGLEAKAIINQRLKHLMAVSEYEIDYLRPHWVEVWMKEEREKQILLDKQNKKRCKQTKKR